jgi:hypothetical protein
LCESLLQLGLSPFNKLLYFLIAHDRELCNKNSNSISFLFGNFFGSKVSRLVAGAGAGAGAGGRRWHSICGL